MSVTRETIKALFYQLVKAAGGVEAAGACLEISHQRVSQLQSLGNNEVPTIMHIVGLEAFVGQPILTGYLAKECAGGAGAADPMKEAVEVASAANTVLRLVHGGAPKSEIHAAVVRLKDEADDVAAATST